MNTQFDLAAEYEQLADESDEIAEVMVAGLEYSTAEIRRTRIARASILRHEAEHLREKARQLRSVRVVPGPAGSEN